MGKQINDYIGYEDFLKVAEQAVKSGCKILKKEHGKIVRGNSSEMLTPDSNRYYFYLPEAGELEIQIQNNEECIGGYGSSGTVCVERERRL